MNSPNGRLLRRNGFDADAGFLPFARHRTQGIHSNNVASVLERGERFSPWSRGWHLIRWVTRANRPWPRSRTAALNAHKFCVTTHTLSAHTCLLMGSAAASAAPVGALADRIGRSSKAERSFGRVLPALGFEAIFTIPCALAQSTFSYQPPSETTLLSLAAKFVFSFPLMSPRQIVDQDRFARAGQNFQYEN